MWILILSLLSKTLSLEIHSFVVETFTILYEH